MNEPNCPCIGCKDRTAECHGKCFKYIIWGKLLRQYKKSKSDYWHEHGFDPAEKERRRKLKAMWMKTK